MTAIDMDELRGWARECGELARGYFNRVSARRKADQSPVTEADTTIERLLVERISARYPGHGIIGEETTRRDADVEFVWALDPLDGTSSFLAGLPIWGVSIGLLRRGLPYAGLFYMPLTDECYWAVPGGGAWLNDRPIAVVAAPHAWDSEDWLAVPSDAHRRLEVSFGGKTRSLGSAAAAICYVARGSAVGGVLTQAAVWDLAGGLAVLAAAGGVAEWLSGGPLVGAGDLAGGQIGEPLLVGAPTLLPALRETIRVRPAAIG